MPKELKYPTEKELEKNRLYGIIEGASSRIIVNLTSGAFLVGILKYMNASDAVCGYILAIPVLAAVIQVLSPIILESLPSRKRIIIIGSLIHRLLISFLIFIPFLPVSTNAKLLLSGLMFLISYLVVSFVSPSISIMYVSFVPQNIRGKYFGVRESYILSASTIITLVLGKVLDIFTESDREVIGYIVIYGIVFILTVINFLSYFFMKEVPLIHTAERIKISEIFTLPFKDRRFIVYFIMLIIWNISIQIGFSYFSVYLKSDLNLNYTTITIFSMINSIFYILAARLWGRFADKNGWASTTMINMAILGVCHGLWFFVSEGSAIVLFLLTIAHMMGGTAWSGINVALFNLQFDFTPDEKRTVYIGFSAAISGIIGYLAAVAGSELVNAFGKNKILFLGYLVDIKQILFLSSSVLLLVCAAFILIKMKPVKTIETKEVTKNV